VFEQNLGFLLWLDIAGQNQPPTVSCRHRDIGQLYSRRLLQNVARHQPRRMDQQAIHIPDLLAVGEKGNQGVRTPSVKKSDPNDAQKLGPYLPRMCWGMYP
jgi:hypothetical protein